jgi:hypothetical protein
MELILIFIIGIAFIVGLIFTSFDINKEAKKIDGNKVKAIKTITAGKPFSIKDTIQRSLAVCPIGYMWETEKKIVQYWEGPISTPHIKGMKIFETRSWERIDSEDPRWKFVPSKAKISTEEFLHVRLIGPNGVVKSVKIPVNRHLGSIEYTMKDLGATIEIRTEEIVKNLILDTEEWDGVYFKS